MSADPTVTAIAALIDEIAEPGDDLDDVVDTWSILHHIIAELSVHARTYSTAAAAQLAELGYDPKHGYHTAAGTVVHHRTPSTDEWDGRGILEALTHPGVDLNTGEKIDAVRVDTLADIIPAIDGTSSRWKTTGLKDHGVDPDRFRRRVWKPAQLQEGPKTR